MKETKTQIATLQDLKSIYLNLTVIWLFLITFSLAWNLRIERQGTLDSALILAQSSFEKDILYRRWSAQHGGVYAPVNEETQPNPYLSVKEREITTPSGRLLTLINPAYMNRQIFELAERDTNYYGHITSLKPLRPENAPDLWEKKALQSFEKGTSEVSSVEKIESVEYMRLMRPLVTERSCLKCHAKQGYKEGDVRGGISVSVPLEPFSAIEKSNIIKISLIHLILWFSGQSFIYIRKKKRLKTVWNQIKAEKKIADAEERFRNLFNFANDPQFTIEGEKITSCNKAALEVFSCDSEEDLLHHNPAEFSPPTQPDGQDSITKGQEFLRKTLEEGSQYFEWMHCDLQGNLFPTMVSLSRINVGDKVFILCRTKDISERKAMEKQLREYSEQLETKVEDRTTQLEKALASLHQSEQRLALHVEQSPVGFIEYNKDFEVTSWNPAAEHIFGFRKDEILGRNVGDFILTESVKGEVEKIMTDLVSQRGGKHSINENLTADGRTITCEWYNTPLVNEQGEIIAISSLVQDVSARIEHEELLDRSRKQAENADRTKSDFLANISHELRTPMNSIIGNLYLMQQSNLTGNQKEYMAEVDENAKRLNDLIDTILDFSKLDGGQLLVKHEHFFLYDVLSPVFTEAERQSQQKGISFVVEKRDLPLELEGDGEKLAVILRHLLDNAVKFTEKGEIVVQLESMEASEDSVYLRCSVTDTGVGMENGQKDIIFRSFTQADGSSTRKYGGLGLGLTLCKKLVEQMDGEINLISEPGRGSTFTFQLKFRKVSSFVWEGAAVSPYTVKSKELVTETNELQNVDVTSLLPDLQTLEVLLKKNDLDSISFFNKLKQQVISIDSITTLDMMRKLEDFDFEGAYDSFRILRESIRKVS